MEKVVLDTNVVISGTYWAGDSRKILKMLEDEKITVIASIEIVKEYLKVLQRPDILEKIDETQVARQTSTQKLFQKLTIIDPKVKTKLSKDPDDNKFIDVAIEGNVNYIISQDNDLLELVKVHDITILSPRSFISKYKKVFD